MTQPSSEARCPKCGSKTREIKLHIISDNFEVLCNSNWHSEPNTAPASQNEPTVREAERFLMKLGKCDSMAAKLILLKNFMMRAAPASPTPQPGESYTCTCCEYSWELGLTPLQEDCPACLLPVGIKAPQPADTTTTRTLSGVQDHRDAAQVVGGGNCPKCGKPKFGPSSTICSAEIGKAQEFYCGCGEVTTFTVGAASASTESPTPQLGTCDAPTWATHRCDVPHALVDFCMHWKPVAVEPAPRPPVQNAQEKL